jgi:hypothetical protein
MAGIPLSTLQAMAMSGDIQARRMLDAFEARYAEHARGIARNGACGA